MLTYVDHISTKKLRYFTSFVRIEVFCPDIPSLYLAHNTREEGGVVEEKRDDAEENS